MPGKACDKYKGQEKQDCLAYRGRFAKKKKSNSKTPPSPQKRREDESSRGLMDLRKAHGSVAKNTTWYEGGKISQGGEIYRRKKKK